MSVTRDYEAILKGMHDGSNWGASARKYSGAAVEGILFQQPRVKTVLDFGSGKGTLGEYCKIRNPRLEWTNYDPGVPGIDVLPDKRFDCVTSTDCLEHVEPHLLDETIRELGDRAGILLLLDIPCHETGQKFPSGPYKGLDLHMTVEEPEWWLAKLNGILQPMNLQVFEWRVITRLRKGRYKKRAFFVYERIG